MATGLGTNEGRRFLSLELALEFSHRPHVLKLYHTLLLSLLPIVMMGFRFVIVGALLYLALAGAEQRGI
jgi:hypothetical protein